MTVKFLDLQAIYRQDQAAYDAAYRRVMDSGRWILGPELAVTHMGADCVEIGPAGIDKAAGLAWLCAHLGVDRADVVAFGDEHNDHAMLRWAGHGVAMANANEQTRALADEIAPSNVDDGVAVVIERLLAERR